MDLLTTKTRGRFAPAGRGWDLPARWLGLATAFVLGTGAVASGQARAGSLEYQVKAAYLVNFTRYVEWPGTALPTANSPVEICVLGKDPFGESLDQVTRNRRSQGRPITLRRIGSIQLAQACHLVFVTDNFWNQRREEVASLALRGILTVGDSEQFARSGGVIGFVISDETVRFVVNLHAMERSGLRISSRMLSLAKQLHRTEGPRF